VTIFSRFLTLLIVIWGLNSAPTAVRNWRKSMNDIANDMLRGVLCEGCGEYLGEEVGHPRRCRECKQDQDTEKQLDV